MISGYHQYGVEGLSRAVKPSRSEPFSLVHKEAVEAILTQKGMEDRLVAVGIAANQVEAVTEYVEAHNLPIPRVFLLLNREDGNDGLYWNPKIIRLDGNKVISSEGCLSIQGDLYKVERYESLILQYENAKGEIKRKAFKDMDAIIVQHEVDHLNGVTIKDAGTLV
jgi:peptide deformylase